MTNKLTAYISYLGFLIIITVIVAAGGTARQTFAAGPATQIGNDISSINQKVAQLIAIRSDNSLTSTEKNAKEFQVQRDILNGVIDLSNNEIASAKDKLNALPKFNEDSPESKLRSGYLDKLASYSAYFNAAENKIIEAADIDNLKAIAADIKNFRSGGYNDEIQNIITFTLIYYDADIIATAQTRLDKLKIDISKLQNLGLLRKDFQQDSLAKAASLINEASELQNQAKEIVLEPPQTATNEIIGETATSDKANTDAGSTTVQPPTPRDLINKSISEIKNVYDIFLQISKDIGKTLGLK
jgi:hypothetical protein